MSIGSCLPSLSREIIAPKQWVVKSIIPKQKDYESGRFTNTFVGYGSEEDNAVIELTYNWDTHEYDVGDGFGHIAIGVPDVYATCDDLREKGVKITRDAGPMKHGGGVIAFIEDPNGYKIELTTRKE